MFALQPLLGACFVEQQMPRSDTDQERKRGALVWIDAAPHLTSHRSGALPT